MLITRGLNNSVSRTTKHRRRHEFGTWKKCDISSLLAYNFESDMPPNDTRPLAPAATDCAVGAVGALGIFFWGVGKPQYQRSARLHQDLA
jgi:hypothetical protein